MSQTCAEVRNDIDCDSPELTTVDTGCAQNVPSQSSRLTARAMWAASHPTVGAADGSTPRRAEYSTEASLYRVALEVFVGNRLGHNRFDSAQPRGRPSTRWAMMLRWISEVPPEIVPAKLDV